MEHDESKYLLIDFEADSGILYDKWLPETAYMSEDEFREEIRQ